MTCRALIRKQGPLLQVSAHGQPLPEEVVFPLTKQLLYTHFHPPKRGYSRGDLDGGHTELRRMYSYDATHLLITRQGYLTRVSEHLTKFGFHVDFENLDPPKHPRVYEPDWERVASLFEFRYRQDECLAAMATAFPGGIVDGATGMGKMYQIAMLCALFPNARFAVATKATSVANTISQVLSGFIPAPGRVGGSKKLQMRVTVYNLDSLHKSPADEDFLLVDEVHQACTDRYVSELSRWGSARMFGLSASTDTRTDNAHAQLEGLFGPTIFKLDYQEAVANNLVVPLVVQWLGVPMANNPVEHIDTGNLTERKRLGIWQNEVRNSTIARVARTFYEQGQQCLIAVETVEHAMWLRRVLPEFEMVYAEGAISDEDRAYFVQAQLLPPDEPRMTTARREVLRKKFESGELKGVIATTVWSTGVSFNHLQVLIRAEGSSSETANIQVPGRVTRRADGKEFGIVIDLMDDFDPGFRDAAGSRRRSYAKRGWQQLLPDGQEWRPRKRAGTAVL